jgi:hypothetical protein
MIVTIFKPKYALKKLNIYNNKIPIISRRTDVQFTSVKLSQKEWKKVLLELGDWLNKRITFFTWHEKIFYQICEMRSGRSYFIVCSDFLIPFDKTLDKIVTWNYNIVYVASQIHFKDELFESTEFPGI